MESELNKNKKKSFFFSKYRAQSKHLKSIMYTKGLSPAEAETQVITLSLNFTTKALNDSFK